jgi:hypothetical protein
MAYRFSFLIVILSLSLAGLPGTARSNPSIEFEDTQPASPSMEEAAALAQQAAELSQRAARIAAAAQAERAPTQQSQNSAAPPSDDLIELVASAFDSDGVVHAVDEEELPSGAGPYVPTGTMDSGCCDQVCPPPRPLIWVAGVEASFLWPDVNSNEGAVFGFEDEAQESEVWHSSFSDSVDSMYLTPRIWLGVQGCAWGVGVRYWHLRACEGSSDSSLEESNGWGHNDWDWDAVPEVGYFDNNCLDAYTVDLEVNRRFCIHDCAMQASFGVRHGSVEHHESIVGTAFGDDARFISFARADRYSRGTGIVLGLYGRKPLFPCSCLHWFYNARWSALWGPTATSAETFAAVMADGSSAGSVNGASTCVGDTMFIGEIQLGLEWNYALRCLPANAFFRAALEYQRWDGGTGFSESASFAEYTDSNDFSSEISAYTSAAEPQMDLVGITIGTGLTW